MIRFVTFEGGDGTGKTTQIQAAEKYLRERNRACVVTREPGGTALGQLIRKVLVEVGDNEIAPATELFLYLADRAQHVHQIVRPAIDAGKIVLCDRFTDSTLVYQGYGRGIELGAEDLTFLFDCPVDVGQARTALRQAQAAAHRSPEDRFEREEIQFHEKVRRGFLEIARWEPERFRIVDAARSVSDVTEEVCKILERELL